eukprot:SAG31_NODE_714_length_12645_cov_15.347760_7_plen_65_part_00
MGQAVEHGRLAEYVRICPHSSAERVGVRFRSIAFVPLTCCHTHASIVNQQLVWGQREDGAARFH